MRIWVNGLASVTDNLMIIFFELTLDVASGLNSSFSLSFRDLASVYEVSISPRCFAP